MRNFNISAWALDHQALVRFFIFALIAAGAYSYSKLGQAEDPPFTSHIMVVQVYWPGATAREMEQQVTDKIEKKLQETPYLDFLRSYSKPGEAAVFVTVRESTPPKEVVGVWYQVRKKVDDIRQTLPQGVIGPFFNDEFGDTFGSVYAFTSDGFTYAELKAYVDRARQELLRLNDVSKVDVIGTQDEKVYIELSSKKLNTLGLSPATIFNTLATRNDMTPAGRIDAGGSNVYVRLSGDFTTVESIREVGIRANNRSFRLGDIARVYRDYVDPPTFKMRYMGQEAIGLAISIAPGGNIIELGRALDDAIRRIKSELPVGIEAHQVTNQPKVVKNAINLFLWSLAEALAIVLAVSFLSLGLRTGVVVALCIPLVIAGVFVVMHLCGIDLHRISLGALIIALGLLVDDAIIAVEMMSHKIEEGWDRVKAASFAYTSTAFPMLTGTLITAAVFLPVGLAKSRAGEYTFAIFAVIMIALVLSWFVAVIFTPYIGYMLLPNPTQGAVQGSSYDKPFYRVFRRIVAWCVGKRKTVIVVTLAAFVAAVAGFRLVEQQFFPASDRPELLVDLWLPEGASFAATEGEVKKLEELLASEENVVNYVAYVGGATPRFFLTLDQQLQNLNYAQFVILTKGLKEREALLQKVRAAFNNDFPLVRGRAQRLENGPPVGYPIQFRVVGENPSLLRKIADEVAGVMRANPNTRNVNFDWSDPTKTVRFEMDQDKARALGMTSQGLAQSVNGILSGFTIAQFREGDKLIDVVARAEASERDDLSVLRDINVFLATNRSVPLSQVANIKPSFEEGVIWRRNRLPAITVRADIPDTIQAPSVAVQIMPELNRIQAGLPSGYRIEVGGAQESSAKAQKSILAVVPLMVFIILTLLMLQLQSFQRTLLVLLTAPLGIIGVTIFLLIFRMPFGFVTMLGVISLTGMIMRNSLILVNQIDQDIKAGSYCWHAIIDSTVRRFRPIMLTALATILAMIPLSRSVFWGPMAVAIMGGLFIATLLTLFFEPALYAAWYRVKKPEHSLDEANVSKHRAFSWGLANKNRRAA